LAAHAVVANDRDLTVVDHNHRCPGDLVPLDGLGNRHRLGLAVFVDLDTDVSFHLVEQGSRVAIHHHRLHPNRRAAQRIGIPNGI